MTNLNLIKPILPILFLLSFLLTSCGILKPSDARKVSPNVDERVKQAIQEGRGFSLGKGIGRAEQILNLLPPMNYGEPH